MSDAEFIGQIDRLAPADVRVVPAAPDLRVRHVRRGGADYYLLFNEGAGELEIRLDLSAKGERILLDPLSGGQSPLAGDNPIRLARHTMQVLAVA